MPYDPTKANQNTALAIDFADIFDRITLLREKLFRVKTQLEDQGVIAAIQALDNGTIIMGIGVTKQELLQALAEYGKLADLFDPDATTGQQANGYFAKGGEFDIETRKVRLNLSFVGVSGTPLI